MTITITEALAEIKTINARLVKKRAAIQNYLMRDMKTPDPLEKDGGSLTYIAAERQSIGDLEERLVRIRTAIQRKNCESVLTVGGVLRPISEWLNWKREIAPHRAAFHSGMYDGIQRARADAQRKGYTVVDPETQAAQGIPTVVVNLDEKRLVAEIEALTETLGALDGKLSLANATITVEV